MPYQPYRFSNPCSKYWWFMYLNHSSHFIVQRDLIIYYTHGAQLLFLFLPHVLAVCRLSNFYLDAGRQTFEYSISFSTVFRGVIHY